MYSCEATPRYLRAQATFRRALRLKQAFDQRDFLLRMRARTQGKPKELLPRLRTPTLVLHPRDYAMSDSSDSMEVAQLARATMTLIDGASAFGDAEQSIRAIEAFLAGISSSATAERVPKQTTLSPREVEVLRLITAGKSNQQIADELVISLNTVRRHVSNIFGKTGAANRAGAAMYARDHGLA
jgi:DNA-binding NarL/FixJ family response regulator